MQVEVYCHECKSEAPMRAVWHAAMGSLHRCDHCGAERVVSIEITKRKDGEFKSAPPEPKPGNSCTAIVKYGPTLTTKDKRFLHSLRVAWEGDDR